VSDARDKQQIVEIEEHKSELDSSS